MVNSDFCEFLAYKLGPAFEHSDNEEVRGFWCDGILLSEPDQSYSKKFINDNGQIILKAFIGKDGQIEYQLKLIFGRKALSRYARDLEISVCVPDPLTPVWFTIDVANH
jgi:hypothetical protein